MSHSSTYHSYSVELAIELKSRDKAIIIHHFQHWIKINRRKKSDRHFKDRHWWTYQKIEDICASLPEFTPDSLKHHIETLVTENILIKGNYNKFKIDKTCWYAFVDEDKFLGTDENSNNPYERGKPPSTGENPYRGGENPNAIPDPKSSDPKSSDKKIYKKGRSAPPSANASALADFFLMKIKEVKPDFKPLAFKKWALDFESMLKEGRDFDLAKKIIEYLVTDKANLIYVQSASKFKKNFDSLQMKMELKEERLITSINREYSLKLKDKYPEQLKSLKFDDKFVGNRETGKEIPFNLPPTQFKEIFVTLFGGQHVR